MWFVTPVQFGVCFVTLIGVVLTGGYGCKVRSLTLFPHLASLVALARRGLEQNLMLLMASLYERLPGF